MSAVLRIQDRFGRGPWKPGFSHIWLDKNRTDFSMPSLLEDFPLYVLTEVRRMALRGMHCGCGCSDWEQLAKWFTDSERATLAKHGYYLTAFKPDRIIAQSSNQVVFAHKTHLAKLKPLMGEALATPTPGESG